MLGMRSGIVLVAVALALSICSLVPVIGFSDAEPLLEFRPWRHVDVGGADLRADRALDLLAGLALLVLPPAEPSPPSSAS